MGVTPEELDALAEECALETCHKDANERIPIIRSALDQVLAMQREEVIEECAKVCDDKYAELHRYHAIGPIQLTVLAAAIRALKG